MKNVKFALLSTFQVLCLLPMAGHAQDTARVLSSTPVLQRVGVPQQVCSDHQVVTPGQKSGAGALMGAIAGGAIGNAVGQGSGRDVATALGLVGGAVVGNNIEGSTPDTVKTVRQCETQTVYQDKVVAFNVLYEYAGKQYSVQSPLDPGPYLPVQIVPILPSAAPPPVIVQRPHMQRYRD